MKKTTVIKLVHEMEDL